MPLIVGEMKKLLAERKVKGENVVGIFVLRSGVAFLEPFARMFPQGRIAFVGLKRDEKTAKAAWYYEHIPTIHKHDTVIIFDPMLATGGSAWETLKLIKKNGATPACTFFAGVIAAPEGIDRVNPLLPRKNIVMAAVDDGLDSRKFIVPGLGDFGDRFVGYEKE